MSNFQCWVLIWLFCIAVGSCHGNNEVRIINADELCNHSKHLSVTDIVDVDMGEIES